jgi:hypothetical protein
VWYLVTGAPALPCWRMLISASVTALALALVGGGSDLPDLVRVSDRVFLGTIVETRRFESARPNAAQPVRTCDRVRVERTFWGDPAISEIVLLRPVGVWSRDKEPGPGSRAVFCTQPADTKSSFASSELLAWSAGAEIEWPALGWAGFFPILDVEGRAMVVLDAERDVLNPAQALRPEAFRRPRPPTTRRVLEKWIEDLLRTI